MKMSNKLPIFDLPTAILNKIEEVVKKATTNIINDSQIIAIRIAIETAEKEANNLRKYIGAGVPSGSS